LLNSNNKPPFLKMEDINPAPVPITYQFRLIHLIYAAALICAALAAWGAPGVLLAVFGIFVWRVVFASKDRMTALGITCLVVVVTLCLAALLFPADSAAREAAKWMSCGNNIKHITLGLHNYHDMYGTFPPAIVRDDKGKPMYSWRVLLLPFVEQTSLYEKYDLDEPWDGPNNREFASITLWVYRCPEAGQSPGTAGLSDYVAVVGPETAWHESDSHKIADFKDGLSSTVLVLEAPETPVPWSKPCDLSMNEAIRLLSTVDSETAPPHRKETFLALGSGGRNVGFANGEPRYMKTGIPRDTCRAMLTIDGGESETAKKIRLVTDVDASEYKIPNLIGVAAFIILLLLPLVVIAKENRGNENSKADSA
jgi:hypothetical protein